MFGQCPIFAYLALRSILMLCEQGKIGEDGVLAEYLLNFRCFWKIKVGIIDNPFGIIIPIHTSDKHRYQ
jgi:hypothetical protein